MKVYEAAFQPSLPRRLPVIIRVDGRAFHSFTRGIVAKPFDDTFRHTMARTAQFLCEQIAGAKFAYTQSDEISVLTANDDRLETQPWFNNDLCKIVSLSASLTTIKFRELVETDFQEADTAIDRLPTFDARAFVVPTEEVGNYYVWRQRDWERNSVQMAARAHFSQKQLQGLNNSQLQEKLWKEKKVNWNDFPVMHKRGVCVLPGQRILPPPHEDMARGWGIDYEPPIFTKDRTYINKRFRWPKEA